MYSNLFKKAIIDEIVVCLQAADTELIALRKFKQTNTCYDEYCSSILCDCGSSRCDNAEYLMCEGCENKSYCNDHSWSNLIEYYGYDDNSFYAFGIEKILCKECCLKTCGVLECITCKKPFLKIQDYPGEVRHLKGTKIAYCTKCMP